MVVMGDKLIIIRWWIQAPFLIFDLFCNLISWIRLKIGVTQFLLWYQLLITVIIVFLNLQ